MKKIFMVMLFLMLFIPISVFAATKYLIPGGQNIGIKIINTGPKKIENSKILTILFNVISSPII